MQLVIESGGTSRDVDVNVQVPDATVSDLLDALGGDTGRPGVDGIVIDGRYLQGYLGLAEAGLHDGAVIHPGYAGGPSPRVESGPMLAVVGGLDTGHRVPLGPGRWVVGRDPGCDLPLPSATVSGRHCAVEVDAAGAVTVEDLGSRNGTLLDGLPLPGRRPLRPGQLLQVGAVQLTLARPGADRPALFAAQRTAGGNTSFNRPPRAMPAPEPEPVPRPKPPREAPTRQPFSWIALIAPLLLAVVLVWVSGTILFALFALLSPVMMVGNWVEGRRHGKRTTRQESARFAADLRAFRARLAELRTEAAHRSRAELPDPSEVLRRAVEPSVRLWERRVPAPDFLRLTAGTGAVQWPVPVTAGYGETPAEVTAAVAAASRLELVPVPVDLADGGVVGITGPRPAALALARSLVCQAAVHHGPADVRVAVLAEPDAVADWEWAKWLPHTRDAAAGGGARLLADDLSVADGLLRELLEARAGRPDPALPPGVRPPGPVLLTVLDAVALTEGRNAPARAVLRGAAGPAAGIVLAPTTDRLPSVCSTVVELLDADGTARLTRPRLGETVDGLLIGGMSAATARSCALALARFEDPETTTAGASLPARVDVTTLFEDDVFEPAAVLGLWGCGGADPGLAAPIGVTEDGVLTLDLVRDGPHGLIGGTTGSGKSELLRSLVAALALRISPERLNFVLIDYKGGSAFDECARLPHTVGLVTDLDAQLGERALRCLEAELRHRERLLREAGADDLPGYLRRCAGSDGAGRPVLPRLMVVIDEFATMAAELPDFMESLVGVAQRGRSLGVHLLLATQRPSGAVKDNIRANTNLRIALRVQDDGDSTDVIGKPDAARIGRGQPGRAFVRLGPGEVVPIQTALVTGVSRRDGGRVDVAGFGFGRRARGEAGPVSAGGTASDLVRVVAAAREAFARSGLAEPRRPWPEPLPDELPLESPALRPVPPAGAGSGAGDVVPVALADDPDAQAQYPAGWRPSDGNLLLYGLAGSGTSTALAALAVTLAARTGPDDLHLYVLDFGAGAMSALAGLPHTGAVIGATEGERQRRLIRMLRGELDRRRDLGPACRGEPDLVLLLDGYAAFRAEYDEPTALWVQEELTRVVNEGPALGVRTVITADRTGVVPTALSSTIAQKWLFRLSEPYDYAAFGVRMRAPAALVPGRCVAAETGLFMQVGLPGPSLVSAVARVAAGYRPPVRPPAPLGTLPAAVGPAELHAAARLDERPWALPVGVAESTLGPATLRLYPAEHALIAGPARSGRSGILVALARLLAAAAPDVAVTGVATRPSPLRAVDGLAGLVTDPAALPDELSRLAARAGRHVVLIDDAEMVDDPSGSIDALIKRLLPDLHVVAAGRADLLRVAYGHWTQTVRRSGAGILLRPDPDFDGDLLAVRLPRRTPVALGPARGWLAHGGDVEFVQAMTVR